MPGRGRTKFNSNDTVKTKYLVDKNSGRKMTRKRSRSGSKLVVIDNVTKVTDGSKRPKQTNLVDQINNQNDLVNQVLLGNNLAMASTRSTPVSKHVTRSKTKTKTQMIEAEKVVGVNNNATLRASLPKIVDEILVHKDAGRSVMSKGTKKVKCVPNLLTGESDRRREELVQQDEQIDNNSFDGVEVDVNS